MGTFYRIWVLMVILTLRDDCILGAEGKSLTIGYAIPYTKGWPMGVNMAPAIIQGIREVRNRHLLDDFEINWTWRDSWCQPLQAIRMAVDMKFTADHLDVIIGEACSAACQPVGLLAGAWSIPFVSMGCLSPKLSDRMTYPTFSRVIGTTSAIGPAYDGLAEIMGWTRVGIVYDSTDVYRSMAEAASKAMELSGRTVYMRSIARTMTGDIINMEKYEQAVKVMADLKTVVRIIYIFTTSQDRRNSLIIARDLGMMNGEYAFATSAVGPEIWETDFTFRPEIGPELYEGVLNRDTMEPAGESWDKFCLQVLDDFSHPQFDGMPHPPPNSTADHINVYAGMVHDAVLAWAYGVNKTVGLGFSPNDGIKVTQNINSLDFEGITGTVATDYQGERKPSYKVEIIQRSGMVRIMEWDPVGHKMVKVYMGDNETDWSGLVWAGNASQPPSGLAPCGWDEARCEELAPKNFAASWAALGVVAVVAVLIGFTYLIARQRLNSELKAVYANLSDIEQIEEQTKSRSSLDSSVASNRFYTKVGRFRGELVSIKRLGSKTLGIANQQVKKDLRMMKEMKQENVNSFIGICLEQPNACVLMTYASRGSLQDILGDDKINIMWDLKVSFAMDIARGMKYIHSSAIGYHGHLKSSNCVVDSRWICKVTDYGLRSVMSAVDTKIDNNEETVKHLLWIAPEILRNCTVDFQLADVYSFGIILHEVVTCDVPYAEERTTQGLQEILQKIASGEQPFRPNIPEGTCTEEWLSLMTECWSEDPMERPEFRAAVNKIRIINHGKQQNLVDNMISRLEGHTSSLEKIVAERSLQLHEEKAKMDTLLTDLLPTSVIESLKCGKEVAPETFDAVTIMFSDIVSFTRISSLGTPLDVVYMLNTMYTVIDQVSTSYDVYKIATIGDAYFVASGVPVRNGDDHATQICGMALQLLSALNKCHVPHIPGEMIRLRIGVHTGPIVAGIAGVKMPRYLLFGDTVDVAEKLEAEGLSMKIHISEATAAILKDKGGFCVESHGRLSIQGVGEINTFWLNGSTEDTIMVKG